ncbi:MAG: SDR family oxidoreductase [Bacteroidetes bacterium]|nr:SDR family oxidoreductase [Bacteroidota bacterium]
MHIDLTNKVALITGSSRGIGRATALQCAASGAKVVVHYRKNKEAAEEVFSNLPGQGHMVIQGDQSDPGSLKNLVEAVIYRMGHIDILVNNAAIFEEKLVIALDFEGFCDFWERTIKTNLNGVAHLSFLVAKHMITNGGGKIINISSRGAFRGEPDAWPYGASKAGVNALGQSMAKALAPHKVYVYTVAPGWVETDMTAHAMTNKSRAAIINQSPMKRIARPDEIARTIVFLASDGTEYMSGCIVDMNGASYLRT